VSEFKVFLEGLFYLSDVQIVTIKRFDLIIAELFNFRKTRPNLFFMLYVEN